MSFVFDIDGETVWSPALRVGQAFVGCAHALGQVVGVSPGFVFNAEDMVDVDALHLESFVTALSEMSSGPAAHLVLANLIDAVRIPCIVMLDRGRSDERADRDLRTSRLVDEVGAAMPR